uniref:Keratin n=1 Tax=Taeniopygia guttata TaxID=59729 RepID=H0Z1J0_TAEGU
MSCYDLCPPRTSTDLCPPRTSVAVPQPIAESCNELCPCVQQCADSRAVILPPPVVVTIPGPVLSTFPQESVVGSSGPAWLGRSFMPAPSGSASPGAQPRLWGHRAGSAGRGS